MIYLVMQGEYSDRHVVGYCTSKEEAEKYCAVHNLNLKPWREMNVEECECLDGKIDGNPMVNWKYRIEIDRKMKANVEETPVCVNDQIGVNSISEPDKYGAYYIVLVIGKKDKELALKVAKDTLMKKLALEKDV